MPPDFSLLNVLKRHGVPFVVIGGHAVNFHGHQRATEDIDIIWLRTPESEIALESALVEVAAQYIGRELDPATRIERTHAVSLPYIRSSHLMMLVTNQGFIDLFDYVPGLPEADVNELLRTSMSPHGIPFASLDWLRKMKQASGRPQDLIDLEKLPSTSP